MKHELIDNALNTIGKIIGGTATSVDDLRTMLSNLVEYREWAEKLRVGNHDMNAELIALQRRQPETGEPSAFRMALSKKEGDCRHLTVEDMLLDTLRSIRELPPDRGVRGVLCWMDYPKDGPEEDTEWHARYANISKSQSTATYLGLAIQNAREFLGL